MRSLAARRRDSSRQRSSRGLSPNSSRVQLSVAVAIREGHGQKARGLDRVLSSSIRLRSSTKLRNAKAGKVDSSHAKVGREAASSVKNAKFSAELSGDVKGRVARGPPFHLCILAQIKSRTAAAAENH
jgi:hypothetical protein